MGGGCLIFYRFSIRKRLPCARFIVAFGAFACLFSWRFCAFCLVFNRQILCFCGVLSWRFSRCFRGVRGVVKSCFCACVAWIRGYLCLLCWVRVGNSWIRSKNGTFAEYWYFLLLLYCFSFAFLGIYLGRLYTLVYNYTFVLFYPCLVGCFVGCFSSLWCVPI